MKRLERLVRVWIAMAAALHFLSAIAFIIGAWLLTQVVVGVFQQSRTSEDIWLRSVAFALSAVARAVLAWAGDLCGERASRRVKEAWRDRLVDQSGRLAAGFAAAPGAFPALMADGVDALGPWAARFLPGRLQAGAIPLAIFAAACWADPLSALVLAITGPLIPLFMVLIGRLTRETAQRQFASLLALSGRFGETLRGLFTLKLLGRIPEARSSLEAHNRDWVRETFALLRTVFLSALVLEWLTTISTAVLAVEAGVRLLYGGLSFEPALFILLLAPEFYSPLRQLGLRFHAAQDARASMEKLLEFAPGEAAFIPLGQGNPDRPTPNGDVRSESPSIFFPIEIKGLRFRWKEGMEPLFDGLDLALAEGECLGITGKSGAGKSTLARILLRLETDGLWDAGVFRAGGAPWDGIPHGAWHRRCAWFSQTTHLFHGTVRENLALTAPGADDKELWRALGESGLADTIRKLPAGLDAPVGEDGARFSGGERQRLALARALLKDAPLWVLDEFTSQLDPFTEEAFLGRFAALRRGHTVVIVSHRQAALAACDRVLALVGGRLREAEP
jgi:ATP-binding cassette subfamily C protein CydD